MPQVLKDMVPRMWVPLVVRVHDGSLSDRNSSLMSGMEAFSKATVILLGKQVTKALPGNHRNNVIRNVTISN